MYYAFEIIFWRLVQRKQFKNIYFARDDANDSILFENFNLFQFTLFSIETRKKSKATHSGV